MHMPRLPQAPLHRDRRRNKYKGKLANFDPPNHAVVVSQFVTTIVLLVYTQSLTLLLVY